MHLLSFVAGLDHPRSLLWNISLALGNPVWKGFMYQSCLLLVKGFFHYLLFSCPNSCTRPLSSGTCCSHFSRMTILFSIIRNHNEGIIPAHVFMFLFQSVYCYACMGMRTVARVCAMPRPPLPGRKDHFWLDKAGLW